MKTANYFAKHYDEDSDRNLQWNPETDERTVEILTDRETGDVALGLTRFSDGVYALWDYSHCNSAEQCYGNISPDDHIGKEIREWKKLMEWKD